MSVKSEITGFLKQRLIAARKNKVANANDVIRHCEQLLIDFNKIKNSGEWVHLREIYEKRRRIELVLPSPIGEHKEIRERIAALITRSAIQASLPKDEMIRQANRQRLATKQ